MRLASKGQGLTFAPPPQVIDTQCVKRCANSAKDCLKHRDIRRLLISGSQVRVLLRPPSPIVLRFRGLHESRSDKIERREGR